MRHWFHTHAVPSGTRIGQSLGGGGLSRSPAVPGEHAGDVGVDHGDVTLVREREHAPVPCTADARQREQRLELVGNPPRGRRVAPRSCRFRARRG